MLQKFLPPFLLGIVSYLFCVLCTVLWGGLFGLIGIFKVLIPHRRFKRECLSLMYWSSYMWAVYIHYYFQWMHCIEWDIQGAENLRLNQWYLLIGNHQSWVDAFALVETVNGKIAPFRFFSKREILWVPVIGLYVWVGENPIMHRYSREYLQKHPEKQGRDLMTAYKACQKFREEPVTVCNFVEGTRLTDKKHRIQNSPYRYLLKPKTGGIGVVLSALGDKIKEIIDLTIVYPEGKKTFWDFLCGRIRRVIVRVQMIPVTKELKGDYLNDIHYRNFLHNWLRERWKEKDELIGRILNTDRL